MTGAETRIEHRLRTAGILLIAALVVDAVSLLWSHPTAFLVFVFVGGGLMALGVLVYLYSIVSTS